MTAQWDADEEQIIYRPPPSVCRSCGSTIRVTAPLSLCDTPPQIFLPSPSSSTFPSLVITVQLVLPSSNARTGMRDVAVQVETRDIPSEPAHCSSPPSELSADPTIGDVLLRYLSPSGTGASLSAQEAGDCPAVETTHEAQRQGAALPEPVAPASVGSLSAQAAGIRDASPAPEEAQPQRAAQSDPVPDASSSFRGPSSEDHHGHTEESRSGGLPNIEEERAARPPSTLPGVPMVLSAETPSPAQIAVRTPPQTTFSFTPRNLPPPTVISAGAAPLSAPNHYSPSPSGKAVAVLRPLKPLPRARAVLPARSPSAKPLTETLPGSKVPLTSPRSAVISAKPPSQTSPKAGRTMYGVPEHVFFGALSFPAPLADEAKSRPQAQTSSTPPNSYSATKATTATAKPVRQPHPPNAHIFFQRRPIPPLASPLPLDAQVHAAPLPDGYLQLQSTPPSSPTSLVATSPARPSMTTATAPPAPAPVQSWTSLKDTIARLALDMAPIHLPADIEAGRNSPVRSKARRGARSTASLARRAEQKAAHQMGSAVA